jgi:hypothetical protein
MFALGSRSNRALAPSASSYDDKRRDKRAHPGSTWTRQPFSLAPSQQQHANCPHPGEQAVRISGPSKP